MKALGLCGSARPDGNTHSLMREVLIGAKSQGLETKMLFLHELDIGACRGCRACREYAERCVLVDDFERVIELIRESSLIVIGSPVYMGQASGQTKTFLDRLYSLRRADRTIRVDGTNKHGVTVAVCGRPDKEHLGSTQRSLGMLFRFLNTTDVRELAGPGLSRLGDAASDLELMERARTLGGEIGRAVLDQNRPSAKDA